MIRLQEQTTMFRGWAVLSALGNSPVHSVEYRINDTKEAHRGM